MKRSTISDALRKRPEQIYRDFYYSLLATMNRRSERRRLGMKVNLVDSTTISLCFEKFDWAKFRKKKGGIKLHVMLDSETKPAEQVLISNAVCHDMNAINGKINFKNGEMYVYDRGYACYKYLYSIQLAGAFFVTRLKSNWKYRVVKKRRVAKTGGVRKDQVIRVSGTKKDEYPDKLRLVTFYHKESNKVLKFLTNNFRLAAKKIANIYKTRWLIELFFKWMKQHLKIKSFLSTSQNGVKIQIWCALITYVLLHLIRSRLTCALDVFDLYRRIQDRLFDNVDLCQLIEGTLVREKPLERYHQLELNYA
jgi:hypothetical protein